MPIVTILKKNQEIYHILNCYATNPETGKQNSSFHRLMPIDKTHLSIRMVEVDIFTDVLWMQKSMVNLKIAITVGVHPAVSIAGA